MGISPSKDLALSFFFMHLSHGACPVTTGSLSEGGIKLGAMEGPSEAMAAMASSDFNQSILLLRTDLPEVHCTKHVP